MTNGGVDPLDLVAQSRVLVAICEPYDETEGAAALAEAVTDLCGMLARVTDALEACLRHG